MRKEIGISAAVAAGLLLSSLNASALVLAEKSVEQKLRADIQKQGHGYVACLVKAATNCEKSGALVAQECILETGAAAAPADAKGKFVADIAKCDSKGDFMKKAGLLDATAAYNSIGCPGDSDPTSAATDEPYADMTAYQTGGRTATKKQIDGLGLTIGVLSGCGADPDPAKCQEGVVKRFSGYAFAIFKCQLACENDYKNAKGNGGGSDSTTACSLNALATGSDGDANFEACIAKAYGKATAPAFSSSINTVIMPALSTALNGANNDINNENDCAP